MGDDSAKPYEIRKPPKSATPVEDYLASIDFDPAKELVEIYEDTKNVQTFEPTEVIAKKKLQVDVVKSLTKMTGEEKDRILDLAKFNALHGKDLQANDSIQIDINVGGMIKGEDGKFKVLGSDGKVRE